MSVTAVETAAWPVRNADQDPARWAQPGVSGPVAPIRDWVATQLSAERWRHTCAVAEGALRLAEQHGAAREAVELAAWLHDAAKEWPRSPAQRAMEQLADRVPPMTRTTPALWHAPIAAYVIAPSWGITDPAVQEAIAVHPTGRPGMGLAALVLFVADYTEPTRDPDLGAAIRPVTDRDLWTAAWLVAEEKMAFLQREGRPVHPDALACRDWLAARRRAEIPRRV